MIENFFFVADEILTTPEGKQWVHGLYPDRHLLVHLNSPAQRDTLINIAKLTLMMSIRGLPEGDHLAEILVLYPDGRPMPAIDPARMLVRPNAAATMVLALVPFPSHQCGSYKMRLTVAGHVFEEQFFIEFVGPHAPRLEVEAPPPSVKPAARKAVRAGRHSPPEGRTIQVDVRRKTTPSKSGGKSR